MRFSTHILTMMLATMLVHSVIIINFFLTPIYMIMPCHLDVYFSSAFY